jgi:antitoxin PrlF
MPTLRVSSTGQVTLPKGLLQHLGLAPGERIAVELLPEARVGLKAFRRTGSIEDLFGLLANETNVKLTIEEITQATADAWAGLKR